MKLKKIITTLVASSIIFCSLGLNVSKALASNETTTTAITFNATGGKAVKNFVNLSNTGYSVSVDLTNKSFVKATLKINQLSVIEESTTGIFAYSADEIGNSEIQKIFSQGKNEISLTLCDAYNVCTQSDYLEITADYHAPDVNFAFNVPSGKTILGLGDKVEFNLEANETLAQINASYNGTPLSFLPCGGYKYTTEYVVKDGDINQLFALQFDGWKVSDEAGNIISVSSLGAINFTIDASLPTVKIISPLDKSIYNTREIEFNYLADEAVALKSVALNGQPVKIVRGDFLNITSDGDQQLTAEFEDSAGNAVTVISNFKTDVTAPFISFSTIDGKQISLGEDLTITGTTEPMARVTLEVGQISYATWADSAGSWTIKLDSDDLGVGQYSLTAVIIDEAGNKSTENIGTITIVAQENAAKEDSTVKVALASSQNVSSDTRPAVFSSSKNEYAPVQKNEEEIAKTGLVSSDQDERQKNFNWSVLLIVLALLVLFSAVIAAGYYGYEWVLLTNVSARSKSNIKRIVEKKEPISPEIPKEKIESKKSPDDSDAKPPTVKTRW